MLQTKDKASLITTRRSMQIYIYMYKCVEYVHIFSGFASWKHDHRKNDSSYAKEITSEHFNKIKERRGSPILRLGGGLWYSGKNAVISIQLYHYMLVTMLFKCTRERDRQREEERKTKKRTTVFGVGLRPSLVSVDCVVVMWSG